MDVLYQVGNFIYRRSLRYTLFTAGLGVVGVFANFLELPGFTVKQAIVFPLMVGGASLVGGFLLRLVPSLISARLQTRAQGNGLNLMEDLRKAQAAQHLEALWERAFRHESAVALADGAALFGGWRPPEGVDPEAAAKAEFLARADDALGSDEPQLRQMMRVGIDLRFVEDWRDGAWFDANDVKLREQFDGNATLLDARHLAGLDGPLVSMRLQPTRLVQRFWFWFVTRALAMNVAAAVDRLNRAFATDLINAQVLLWPGEEDDPWLLQQRNGPDEVVAHRVAVVQRVFGPTRQTASELVEQMFAASFAEAMELRVRFDPEYAEGELGDDQAFQPDLRGRPNAGARLQGRVERLLRQGRPRLEAIDAALKRQPSSAAARRAARGLAWVGVPPEQAVAASPEQIERWTRQLVAVRVHHTLAQLTVDGYESLLEELAYP